MNTEPQPSTPTASAPVALGAAVQHITELTTLITEHELGAEVADTDIADLLYAAARLFSAKTDRVGRTEWPIQPDALNATETVVLVTALLEAADINLFDMAIWYRRAQ